MSKQSKPIRLLAVGPLPPPVGGDTVSFTRLVESAVWERNQVKLNILDTSRKSNIRLPHEPVHFSDIFHVIKLLSSYVAQIVRCDKVLICVNSRFLFTVGLSFIIIARLLKKPIWIKPFGGALDVMYRKLFRWHRFLVHWVLNLAVGILPQTKALKINLEQDILENNHCCVWFPNFIADSHWPSDKIASHSPLPRSLVFIGHIKHEKGIFDVLNLLENNVNIYGIFYGPILPRDKEKFMGKVDSLPNAHYGGILDMKDVSDAIAKHAILVLPTFHDGEGYPGILLEAMACGRPVVATKWKAIPELVRDGVDGLLIEPQDQSQLSNAVQTILNDLEKWNRMGQNARENASRFREKKVLQEILLPLLLSPNKQNHSKCKDAVNAG